MMYRVNKLIDFCYGHRLTHYEGKCRHLHGHNGRAEIELIGSALDDRGMVADFGDIKKLIKTWIDENLDHRMILFREDPVLDYLRSQGEPHFVMDENPTAEAIAKLIFHQAKALGLPVSKVTLWETPTSSAIYCEDPGE